jgi:SpoVK/Ycf46/Vps4 family AAA+-type ATPase
LNEIENLEGVLIATTNRIDSLDSAFMRRFLYKVRLEKPTLETRKKILKDKMKFLTENQVDVLAEKYPDLTGGQIENITRKYYMNMVLYETPTKLSEIEEYAAEEQVGSRNKLGFNR